ncbi:MAG TPA: sigma-54 dependent transcriptional regulator [Thermoanaerobaculia bacterium]|nr:sigma-54 dependent transcriptional regulator [Thermoanaerobaculia bacterium]
MASDRILIIDDEQGIRETLSGILEDEGYRTRAAENAGEARRVLRKERFDAALLDVWLPDADGLKLLEEMQNGLFDQPVIVISGHGNIDSAVKAIRLGAYDFLEKPLSLSRVVLTVQHALAEGKMRRQLHDLSVRLEAQEALVGSSPAMVRLGEELRVAARSDSRILITGENGTGKELVARQIHRLSQRAKGPFVDLNCAAIPEELIESELFGHVRGAFTGASADRQGRFQKADTGTVFLDEIADMSVKTQAKVLRAIEEQRFERVGDTTPIAVDVRVVAATNKDLEKEIRENRFREDLYFRLNVIPLHVPALRERREDIPLLVEHFLDRFSQGTVRKTVHRRAMSRMVEYAWPGNVRELRNLIERLQIMVEGDTIGEEDLPSNLREDSSDRLRVASGDGSGTLKEARESFERLYIERQLKRHEGNVTRTAQALGLERSHLHRKLRAYGIKAEREPE